MGSKIDLNGEWIGRYPGHFDETIRIIHTGDVVEAIKVTGDDHVPADEVTWRARLTPGRRYGAGEGQIAEEGHRNPRFIPGQLVIENPERIRFIWTDCGRVDYRRDD